MKKRPLPITATKLSKRKFSEAYTLYQQRILWYILGRVDDKKVAEDLASIVFMKAWKSRSTFKGGSIQAWFYQIARNVMIDYWRKNKDYSLDEDFDPVSDTHDMGESLDDETLIINIKLAMQRLPPPMHAIITMRFIEGRPVKDVAAVMGLSEVNIRVLQYRALKMIRKYLNEK